MGRTQYNKNGKICNNFTTGLDWLENNSQVLTEFPRQQCSTFVFQKKKKKTQPQICLSPCLRGSQLLIRHYSICNSVSEANEIAYHRFLPGIYYKDSPILCPKCCNKFPEELRHLLLLHNAHLLFWSNTEPFFYLKIIELKWKHNKFLSVERFVFLIYIDEWNFLLWQSAIIYNWAWMIGV